MRNPTVPKLSLSRILSLLLLLCVQSVSWAASSDPLYDAFLQCLTKNTNDPSVSSIVFPQTSPKFAQTLRNYIRNARFNTTGTPKPAIIVTPTKITHVQGTVICAKRAGVQIKIRSGGHDYDGISYISPVRFIILDMFNLRSVNVNPLDRTAWVQTGATLGEVYYRIWEKSKSLGFPAGVCPTVGVGGHISGGGYGTMLRKYGLAVDNVVDAQIVDVNGAVLDRKAMGEDLFWAINGGGGGSFGVVLSYKLTLVPVPDVTTVFRIEKTLAQNATVLVHKYQTVAPTIDDDLFIRMLIQPVSGGQKGKKTIRASFISMFLGDANRLVSIMNSKFPELGLKKADCKEMSWIESVLYWANFDNKTSPNKLLDRNLDSASFLKRKSDYLQTPISMSGLESIWEKMIELGKPGLVFNPYGGKMNEIDPTATPFPHRAGNLFKIQYSVNWNEAGSAADENFVGQIRKLYSFMAPFVSKNPRGAFLNYRDLDIGTTDNGANTYNEGKVYGVKYFMGNFDRLVKVKTRVDPGNFFRNEQSIPPFPTKRRMG